MTNLIHSLSAVQLVVGPSAAQEIRQATVKKLDLDKKVITLTVAGKDEELVIAADAQVPGPAETELTERASDRLLTFFKSDSTARVWFVRGNSPAKE